MPLFGFGKTKVSEIEAIARFANERLKWRWDRQVHLDALLVEALGGSEAPSDPWVRLKGAVANMVLATYALDSRVGAERAVRMRRVYLPQILGGERDNAQDIRDMCKSYADVWDECVKSGDQLAVKTYAEHFVKRTLARRIGPRTLAELRVLNICAMEYLLAPKEDWWGPFTDKHRIVQDP